MCLLVDKPVSALKFGVSNSLDFPMPSPSMSENGLVSLAATLKELLASPQSLIPESKAEHDARLDIIDMIPDLNRTLLGDKQTLRDLAWSVSSVLLISASLRCS